MAGGFVKIYGSKLLTSSLWDEDPAARLVFLSMLALADADGIVDCPNVKTLARVLNLPIDYVETALTVLEGPDPGSRSTALEGRRVVREGSAWRLVNYAEYREFRSAKQEAGRRRVEEYRARRAAGHSDASPVTSNNVTPGNVLKRAVQTDADADADTERERDPRARAHNEPAAEPPIEPEDREAGEDANRWLVEFGRAWCTRFSRIAYGNGAADARGVSRLAEKLGTLTREERDRAVASRARILAAYFQQPDEAAKRAGFSFAFFVPRFDALFQAAVVVEAKRSAARVCGFHVANPDRKAPAGSASPLCEVCDRLGAEPLAPWGEP